ncbi:MAG TPA: hypothetical protein VM818_24330 [Vicinamibacterales bacterium]|nr:hypothetical protein [Vicinamibacterales bacterium]
MWVLVAVSVFALGTIGMAAYGTRRTGGPPDVGYVTERWLAEHRAHQSEC